MITVVRNSVETRIQGLQTKKLQMSAFIVRDEKLKHYNVSTQKEKQKLYDKLTQGYLKYNEEPDKF